VTEEPAVPETKDVNQRWAFIDLLLSTAFRLSGIGSIVLNSLCGLRDCG
jgi:hypothetical protein